MVVDERIRRRVGIQLLKRLQHFFGAPILRQVFVDEREFHASYEADFMRSTTMGVRNRMTQSSRIDQFSM